MNDADARTHPIVVVATLIFMISITCGGIAILLLATSSHTYTVDTTLYEGELIGVEYTESFGREHTILNLNNTIILVNSFIDDWHIGSYYKVWLNENDEMYDREVVEV